MVRHFMTRDLIGITPEEFMSIRQDTTFQTALAALEDQILSVDTESEGFDSDEVPVSKRVSVREFQNNPVPPLLRGIIKGDDLRITTEETLYHTSTALPHSSSSTMTKTKLPGKLAEVISIESQQWVERLSDTECELVSEHWITCDLFGVAGSIESAIEGGIRDSFNKAPARMEQLMARKKFGDMDLAAAGRATSRESNDGPGPLEPIRWVGQQTGRLLDGTIRETTKLTTGLRDETEKLVTGLRDDTEIGRQTGQLVDDVGRQTGRLLDDSRGKVVAATSKLTTGLTGLRDDTEIGRRTGRLVDETIRGTAKLTTGLRDETEKLVTASTNLVGFVPGVRYLSGLHTREHSLSPDDGSPGRSRSFSGRELAVDNRRSFSVTVESKPGALTFLRFRAKDLATASSDLWSKTARLASAPLRTERTVSVTLDPSKQPLSVVDSSKQSYFWQALWSPPPSSLPDSSERTFVWQARCLRAQESNSAHALHSASNALAAIRWLTLLAHVHVLVHMLVHVHVHVHVHVFVLDARTHTLSRWPWSVSLRRLYCPCFLSCLPPSLRSSCMPTPHEPILL